MQLPADYNDAPYLVLWELTRACTLACRHCRAKAIRQRNPLELSLAECSKVMDELKAFGRPLIVLTGGDPVQRPDLFEIIDEATARGFTVAITPSATPVTTRSIVHRFKQHGVARLAVSVDGPNAESHDGFRRVKGSFELSMNIIQWAREVDLPVQINTTVARHNYAQFDEMTDLVKTLGVVLWSIFFLVPTGRANDEMQITKEEYESILLRMSDISRSGQLNVKATEGPAFRRVLIESARGMKADLRTGQLDVSPALRLGELRSYQAVNDGRGVLFISHTGDIYPSGFLPTVAGNVRTDSVADVYRNGPLFKALRDANQLQGKCGNCRYKVVCGGSRARAFAATGDYMAEDPLCIYNEPAPV